MNNTENKFVFCISCGCKNSADSRFCISCGKEIEAIETIEKEEPVKAELPEMVDCDRTISLADLEKAKADNGVAFAEVTDDATVIGKASQQEAFAPADDKAAAFSFVEDTAMNRKEAAVVTDTAPAFGAVPEKTPEKAPEKAPEKKAAAPVKTYEEDNFAFASGLPEWSIEPPQVMVRRKGKR